MTTKPSDSQSHFHKKIAFTLVELLVVMGIILILASSAIVVTVGARERAQKNAAKADIAKLEQAIASFESAYKVLPPDNFEEMDSSNIPFFISVLGVIGFPAGGSANPPYEDIEALVFALRSTNGKGPFIEFDEENLSDIDGNGYDELIDPWGRPYRYRTKVQRKPTGYVPRSGDFVDIWSSGPDKAIDPNNNNADDDGDSLIDEVDELVDDIANWNF